MLFHITAPLCCKGCREVHWGPWPGHHSGDTTRTVHETLFHVSAPLCGEENNLGSYKIFVTWWYNVMRNFSALLATCEMKLLLQQLHHTDDQIYSALCTVLLCISTINSSNSRQILRYIWSWWCHQMETFSTLLALCEGNTPLTGGFPSQRPVTQSFDVFFDLHLNKRLCKQSRRW